jgi:type I restriction-modification system DNA methylase subunit
MEDLQRLKGDIPQGNIPPLAAEKPRRDPGRRKRQNSGTSRSQPEDAKRLIQKLHNVVRDADGSSSIVERFEEVTKLLFLAAFTKSRSKLEETFSLSFDDAPTVSKRMRIAYSTLASEHSHIFPEPFRQFRLSDAALYRAYEALRGTDLSQHGFDFKGLAFEEMLKNTFDKDENQQFFTPPEIVQFVIGLAEPFIKGTVCDPAAGTGGFLVEVSRRCSSVKTLVALELDQRLSWVAGINLLLHDTPAFITRCLPQGGSLGPSADEYREAFDLVVTNPPFGSDVSDASLLSRFELGKKYSSRRRGILFVEQCLRMLKNGGYLAIVIDEGVLSQPSTNDVRTLIRQQCFVRAVVSLPETAFMPYASVNTSILLLEKRGSRKPRQVPMCFFGRAESTGRRPNGERDIVFDSEGKPKDTSDLPVLLKSWRSYLNGDIPETSDTVFVTSRPNAPDVDANERLDFRYQHPSRVTAQRLLEQSRYPTATLGDICLERNEMMVPSVDAADTFIPYTGLAHIEPHTGRCNQVMVPGQSLKSAVKRYEKGDVLFARMRPNLRKCAYIGFAQAGYTSPECIVLVVKRNLDDIPVFDPELLAVVLRSDLVMGQILFNVVGIGRPRISAHDLRNVVIPIPPRPVQEAIRRSYMGAECSARELREQAAALCERADRLVTNAVQRVAQECIRGIDNE